MLYWAIDQVILEFKKVINKMCQEQQSVYTDKVLASGQVGSRFSDYNKETANMAKMSAPQREPTVYEKLTKDAEAASRQAAKILAHRDEMQKRLGRVAMDMSVTKFNELHATYIYADDHPF